MCGPNSDELAAHAATTSVPEQETLRTPRYWEVPMTKTIANAVATIGDAVADRIRLADLPAKLTVVAHFNPNMGNKRVGYSFDIDGYGSVAVLVYLPADDKLDGATFKRDDATATRIAGGRRVKFTWEDGDRLVTMTCPVKTPAAALTSITVTTSDDEG